MVSKRLPRPLQSTAKALIVVFGELSLPVVPEMATRKPRSTLFERPVAHLALLYVIKKLVGPRFCKNLETFNCHCFKGQQVHLSTAA